MPPKPALHYLPHEAMPWQWHLPDPHSRSSYIAGLPTRGKAVEYGAKYGWSAGQFAEIKEGEDNDKI
jgi:hypothetical protein